MCQEKFDFEADLVENAVLRTGLESVKDIANYTRLSEESVLRVLKETHTFQDLVPTGGVCDRCKKEPAQPNSTFCLKCRMTLHKFLGDAAGSLSGKLAKSHNEKARLPQTKGLVELVESKRKPTNATRLKLRNPYRKPLNSLTDYEDD